MISILNLRGLLVLRVEEAVRKAHRASLTPKARRGLMHDRYMLLKRAASFTDRDALLLSGWTANYSALKSATVTAIHAKLDEVLNGAERHRHDRASEEVSVLAIEPRRCVMPAPKVNPRSAKKVAARRSPK